MAASSGSRPLEVAIEVATAADVEVLIPLYCGFMLHEGVVPPEALELAARLERLIASESDQVLLARSREAIGVGYLQMRYFWSVWRPRRDAFIEDLFVVEGARAQRVGERLLTTALALARSRNVDRISLDVNENNGRARAVYERMGFANHSASWQGGRQLFYSLLKSP